MSTEKEKSPRGFSGVATMVSDVVQKESDIKEQTQIPINITRQETGISARQEYESSGPTSFSNGTSKTKSGSKLKWFIGIGAIILLYFMFNGGNPSKQNVSPQPDKTVRAEVTFEKPPVGRDNVLNLPQLRWYFREKIRIETMRGLTTNDRAVKEFNAMVDDYNSRCGSFRYKQSTINQAQKEVDAIREQIAAEAIRDVNVRGW